MGTRGIVGLIIDTQIKASYNHFDSYPSGLGLDVVKFVKGIDDLDAVIAQARALAVLHITDAGAGSAHDRAGDV